MNLSDPVEAPDSEPFGFGVRFCGIFRISGGDGLRPGRTAMEAWIEFIENMIPAVTRENLVSAIETLRGFGFILGIGLVSVEAFLPFLPLVLFVTVNVVVFGFFQGYLYSWIGTCLGTILVFFVLRRFGRFGLFKKIHANDNHARRLMKIREKGFTPFFILYCFPFTPSFAVSFVAALSDLPTDRFVAATLSGKLVMILFLSIIGYNVSSLIEQPVRSVLLTIPMLVIGYLAKRSMEAYERRLEKPKA